jgi:hypothetical protein
MVAAGEAAPLRAREADAGGEEKGGSRDWGRGLACYEASDDTLLGAASAAGGEPRRTRGVMNAALTTATLVSKRKRRGSHPRSRRPPRQKDFVL